MITTTELLVWIIDDPAGPHIATFLQNDGRSIPLVATDRSVITDPKTMLVVSALVGRHECPVNLHRFEITDDTVYIRGVVGA